VVQLLEVKEKPHKGGKGSPAFWSNETDSVFMGSAALVFLPLHSFFIDVEEKSVV